MLSGMTIEHPLSLPQIAALYGVTRQAVSRWVASGKLKTRQDAPGHHHKVVWDDLLSFDRTLPAYKRKFTQH